MNDISVASKCKFKYFKIQAPENSLVVKPYLYELENSREEDMKSVMKSVNEVRTDLENLKTEVCSLAEKKSTDCLRKKMFNMEEKISHLKEAIKHELFTLLENEMSLSKDVQFMEKRLEEWGKSPYAQLLKPGKKKRQRFRTNEENAAVALHKFLANSGGRYGGWEEHDHLLFLRERKKYKKKEKFFSALQCLLPDITYDAIQAHEEWHLKHESLKNSQKEAILKWKLQKENQQRQEKHKEKERQKQETKVTKKAVRQHINIAERIKEWKNQQLANKLKEEERQKIEKEKLKAEEKRKRDLQEIKKFAIAQYKQEKIRKLKERESLSKEDEATQKQEAQEAKATNKILLNAFRLQDLKFVEKKRTIRLQIESKAKENIEKLKLTKPALELILQRDPQRVFQPTWIWSQHCTESQKREKINPVFDLNSIPRLAIPEWRKELK